MDKIKEKIKEKAKKVGSFIECNMFEILAAGGAVTCYAIIAKKGCDSNDKIAAAKIAYYEAKKDREEALLFEQRDVYREVINRLAVDESIEYLTEKSKDLTEL